MNENRCALCRFFDRYYTKGATKFNSTKYGWCRKKVGTVCSGDGCEEFERKPKSRRNAGLLKVYLSDLLTEISEMRKIIEAEDEEL